MCVTIFMVQIPAKTLQQILLTKLPLLSSLHRRHSRWETPKQTQFRPLPTATQFHSNIGCILKYCIRSYNRLLSKTESSDHNLQQHDTEM